MARLDYQPGLRRKYNQREDQDSMRSLEDFMDLPEDCPHFKKKGRHCFVACDRWKDANGGCEDE